MDIVRFDENTYDFEVGKIYTVYLECIMFPIYRSRYNFDFEYLNYDVLKNKVTLIKYLGDGKFQEYFTEKIIKIEKNEKKIYDDLNAIEYYSKFKEFIIEPFCVEKERINSGEKNLVRDFPKTDEEISDIRNWINSAANSFRKDLIESLNGCINEDYDKAYVENCIFEFERGNSYTKKRVKDND